MKRCYWDWCSSRCRCRFRVVGYVVGWFGVIYRTLGTGELAIQVSKIEDNEDVFIALGSLLIGYGLVSLGSNFLFIVGIGKIKYNYLIPYLGIYGIEIIVGIIGLIGGVIFFIEFGKSVVLYYFIPFYLFALGVYTYFWFCLVRIYVEFKSSVEENSSINSSESGLVCCSSSCFKSDSLDIATSQ